MRIFVTGGTGFIGGYVLKELQRQGHKSIVLVRHGSERKLPIDFKGEIVSGDVFRFEMPPKIDAAIHLIGILRENKRKGITFKKYQFQVVESVANAALRKNIRRFLLMSANGVKPNGTLYQSTKYKAEEYIRNKGFKYTIFRPSILFGDPDYPSGEVGKPEFCTILLNQLIQPYIPVPMFHTGLNLKEAGKYELQPVHVKDVAKGIAASLNNENSIGKIYHIGGSEVFTWREIVDIIAQVVGRKKWKVPVPGWGVKFIAALFSWLPSFPITRDQIIMLMEGNTCDSSEFYRDFGIDPVPFTIKELEYLT